MISRDIIGSLSLCLITMCHRPTCLIVGRCFENDSIWLLFPIICRCCTNKCRKKNTHHFKINDWKWVWMHVFHSMQWRAKKMHTPFFSVAKGIHMHFFAMHQDSYSHMNLSHWMDYLFFFLLIDFRSSHHRRDECEKDGKE